MAESFFPPKEKSKNTSQSNFNELLTERAAAAVYFYSA